MLREITRPVSPVSAMVKKEIPLCILSAFLLILSFPRFNIEFLAWFAFIPLFFAIGRKSKGKAFLLSYITGVIFWLGSIYWLVHVTTAGVIVLVLYLALYFGVFGWILSAIRYPLSALNLLFIPSAWVLLEYVRAHLFTGFPWVLLGYSQYLNSPLIQIADIAGAWGVSFLIMMLNIFLCGIIDYMLCAGGRKQKSSLPVTFYLLPLFLLFSASSYGFYKLHRLGSGYSRRPIKISVVQGNIPQGLKWESASSGFIIDRYMSLSHEAVKYNPDLIIWPEAALPFVLEKEPYHYGEVSRLIKRINAFLLLGAVTAENSLYHNSALLFRKGGQLLDTYDKVHLVPFGEYIPLKRILGFLETVVPIGDFAGGTGYTVFALPPGAGSASHKRFSVLICFEDLFPALSRNFVKRGAQFLVNITNDAWFKNTSAPYQHVCASVFRAIENRVFLVRCANTGISGFISPAGKIISLVRDKLGNSIFITGYGNGEVFVTEGKASFYTRYGDTFVIACFLMVLLYAVVPRKKIKT